MPPDRQSIGRNNKARAKEYERDVGHILGGKRHPADVGGLEDVETPQFVVQVKSRATFAEWVLEALDGARATAAGTTKKGLLVVYVRRGAGHPVRKLAVMDLEEFAQEVGCDS